MRGHHHTILIVDDEGEGRDAVRDALGRKGVETLLARHGRAALQLLALGIRPCAILIDVHEPAVAGAELRRALQYDANLRDIPVGLLPAPEKAVRGGAGGVPPFDVGDLLASLASCCEELRAFRRQPMPRKGRGLIVRPPTIRRNGS